jgi:transposase-like protein
LGILNLQGSSERETRHHRKYIVPSRWRQVANGFRALYPKLAALLRADEAEVLANLVFPSKPWRQVRSDNTWERLNREVKCGTGADVVGKFSNAAAIVHLIRMILADSSTSGKE